LINNVKFNNNFKYYKNQKTIAAVVPIKPDSFNLSSEMNLACALKKPDALRASKNYIEVMGDNDIKNFSDYINQIDFKKLYELAPDVEQYDSKKLLAFLDYYYKNGINEFNRDTLTFKGDLTEFLSQNHLSATNLEDFFTLFPLTKREIGSIPDGWLKNIPPKDRKAAIEKIYEAISSFQKEIKNEDSTLKLANNLEEILNQKIEVETLKGGVFGKCYRIISDLADNVCLKIFRSDDLPHSVRNKHGQFVEPQTGLFTNNHSNAFVKELFGRAATSQHPDGFLATQYLDEGIKPYKCSLLSKGYKVISTDVTSNPQAIFSDFFNDGIKKNHNRISGKIIDFGGVEVNKKFFKSLFDILFNRMKDYSKYYIGHK